MKPTYSEAYRRLEASPLLDAEWYTEQYPDVATLDMDPIRHYLMYGGRMLRSPSRHFSTRRYVQVNPGVNFKQMNPLLHHILRLEGELPAEEQSLEQPLAFYGERALEAVKWHAPHVDNSPTHNLVKQADACIDKGVGGPIEKGLSDSQVLALAWYFTGTDAYIQKASESIRFWFVEEGTRLPPSGFNSHEGGADGLLKLTGLCYFLDAVRLVKRSGFWSNTDDEAFNAWCEQRLQWLQSCEVGADENTDHTLELAYDLQVYALHAYLGQSSHMYEVLERSLRRMERQFNSDGSQSLGNDGPGVEANVISSFELWLNLYYLIKNTLGYNLFDYRVHYPEKLDNPLGLGFQWLFALNRESGDQEQSSEGDQNRLTALYHSAAKCAPDWLQRFSSDFPRFHEASFNAAAENGVAPFWQLNIACVRDYNELNNRRLLPLGAKAVKRRLVHYLWHGHSKSASTLLLEIRDDARYSLDSRLTAAWELSRWYAFKCDDQKSYECLEFMLSLDPDKAFTKDFVLSKAFCEIRFGDTKTAKRTLLAYLENVGEDPDILFALSNTTSDERTKLRKINQAFKLAGCCGIKKIDGDLPLAMDNIRGRQVKPVERADEKVSIIIPAYNAEARLGIALDSLLAQSWWNLEIIVVDDQSPDQTYKVAQSYAEKDSRVKALKQPVNGGAYSARNAGLRIATGDFITTHDSDDWSHPQKIERQLRHFKTNPSLKGLSAHWIRAHDDLYFTQNWRPGAKLVHVSHSSFIFRRQVYEDLGFWDTVRIGGDNEYIGRLINYYGKDAYSVVERGAPLAFSLDDDGSLTRTKATHVSTVYYGLRHVYRQIWGWQQKSRGLFTDEYEVPLPKKMVKRGNETLELDLVLICDYTDEVAATRLLNLVRTRDSDLRLGLFHWPSFDRRALFFGDSYFELLKEFDAIPIVHGDKVTARHAVVAQTELLGHPVDAAPDVDLEGELFILQRWDDPAVFAPVDVFGHKATRIDENDIDKLFSKAIDDSLSSTAG